MVVDENEAPHISVAAGIAVGLAASFVQSLGLTIQRKSHLQNEQSPPNGKKADWKRPLWLVGFGIFISSNLLGTIFQIGALPIVVLGPLGAVSLLYNAFFAKIILGDAFTIHLITGTVLIAGGAVLIGIFGTVPEQTHSLDELVQLYRRPAFVAWISSLAFVLILVLGFSHVVEWRVDKSLRGLATQSLFAMPWKRKPRRSKSASHSPLLGRENGHARYDGSHESLCLENDAKLMRRIESARLVVGIAYGGSSGTLSGLCLLFAKTGIELLILTVMGKNQFGHIQAWLIVLVLLVAAILQLFYLNRALRLAGPTLICPLAFCFYNLSSIVSGLIFYKQWDMLSPLRIAMVALGTTILLAGVWIVALKPNEEHLKDEIVLATEAAVIRHPSRASRSASTGSAHGVVRFQDESDVEGSAIMSDDEEEGEDGDTASDGSIEQEEDLSQILRRTYIPAGLTIGLGAASPGFDIRPATVQPVSRRMTIQSSGARSATAGRLRSPALDTAVDTDTTTTATEVTNTDNAAPASEDAPTRPPVKLNRRTTLPPDFSPAPLTHLASPLVPTTSSDDHATRPSSAHHSTPPQSPKSPGRRRKRKHARQTSISGSIYVGGGSPRIGSGNRSEDEEDVVRS